MAKTKRNNPIAKAHQTFLAKAKDISPRLAVEYAIAHQTNSNRGQVWDASDIFRYYDRLGQHHGASKCVHTLCHLGWEFETICIKRMYEFAHRGLGNQCVGEVNMYNKIENTPDADFVCPVLKSFKSKSDKVADNSNKGFDNMILVCQKAVYVDKLDRCCEWAYRQNKANGNYAERPENRKAKVVDFCKRYNIHDTHGGNFGVIFDYNANCYKAVIIDYAL